MSFNESSQRVSCELKFFTGLLLVIILPDESVWFFFMPDQEVIILNSCTISCASASDLEICLRVNIVFLYSDLLSFASIHVNFDSIFLAVCYCQ